jgi:hypothetical protein
MRKSVLSLMTLGAFGAAVAIASFPITTIAQQPAGEEKRPADMDPQPFNPQLGALMNMVIQPRHAKLGLAGQAENWPLAGYYFKEMKTGFAVVSRAVPRWKGLPVPDRGVGRADLRGARLRHQGGRAAPVRRVLWEAHAGLQQLPRHHGSPVRGDQSAGRVGLVEPGLQAGRALGRFDGAKRSMRGAIPAHRVQSTVRPISLITLPYFSWSRRMIALNSSSVVM